MVETSSEVLELTEADIPGAQLSEPLESHTVTALRWWLLCRGIRVPTSLNKLKLIERIRELKASGSGKVVDVDGSYLFRKYQTLVNDGMQLPPLRPPGVPLCGWEPVNAENFVDMVKKIPCITPGLLYTYLAEGAGNTSGRSAFRALQRGFTHWSCGHMDHLEVNAKHPDYCHVRCQMTPSMKPGVYHVNLLLKRDGDFATIESAMCECAAGQSASCTHVSGLLHALVYMMPSKFQLPSNEGAGGFSEDEVLPITSYACQWKVPRKRKDSTLQMADITFQKHVYGKERKGSPKPVENFDPRPLELRGTAKLHLPELLEKVRGMGLGISLLLDSKTRCWSDEVETAGEHPLPPQLPSKEELQKRVAEFKKTLRLSPEQCRDIEMKTREQSQSSLWYSVRRFRITASYFGHIQRRLPSTPPHSLVLQMLKTSPFTSAATEWGKKNESAALQQYVLHQHETGHSGLYTCSSGFVISEEHAFLGASPDAVVYDPTEYEPFGLAEVKCPYSCRQVTPEEACSYTNFCCSLNANGKLTLLKNHIYYSQVQGQMGVTKRKWCDFIVYTLKGLSVERIRFESELWEKELVPKLTEFFDNCYAPEIISPIHVLGLPVRDLRQ